MKTNIDNILKVIFENNLETKIKENMLKDGFSNQQIDVYIQEQKKQFELRQKQSNRYSGVHWEDPQLAKYEVEGINEHYARIECQAQQETQEEWIAEQEHNAGGEYE